MQVVVDAVKRLNRWNEQRYKLIQLYHERQEIVLGFANDVKGWEPGSDEYEERLSEWTDLFEMKVGEIGKIETDQAIQRAERWRVPYPPAPRNGFVMDDQYWDWNGSLGIYILNLEGHKQIRHAVATEMDIKFRPWLSWGALIVSGVSLVVAVLKP